jgi:acetylornithine deacetylase/succinyl-diaminopimelate desuccinylase-like protein
MKTVLPEKAMAKISCRLVPHQRQLHIYECIKNYLAESVPPSVKYELRLMEEGAPGVLIDQNTKAMQTAADAYTAGWGTRPLFTREGGSIPIVAGFQQELDSEIVIMSFGYKGCRAHGPNEHVYLEMFHKGIAPAIYFLQGIGNSA